MTPARLESNFLSVFRAVCPAVVIYNKSEKLAGMRKNLSTGGHWRVMRPVFRLILISHLQKLPWRV
jgi:hypothetical protein